MGSRLDLHALLLSLTPNVYFQPPAVMKYPCIKYCLTDVDTQYADNIPYITKKEYLLTVIDGDPESPIPDKVLGLPGCSFDRSYAADNLNHFVFRINF